MSRPRYAPITSSLLVRKGEAKPWSMPGVLDFAAPPRALSQPEEQPAEFRSWPETHDDKPAAPAARTGVCEGGGGTSGEYVKRCTLKLSHVEYERLGIIAVKKEISRQQVLRQAIENYLTAAAHEYESACGCLGGGCRGDC